MTRVRLGVAIGRCNSGCLEGVAACGVYGRFAWQAWGMVDDACVKKMAYVHVTWQAWDSGCMSAFGKMLGGGSAWQVWCIIHFDVAERAFRVAGVGKGGHRRYRARGFA